MSKILQRASEKCDPYITKAILSFLPSPSFREHSKKKSPVFHQIISGVASLNHDIGGSWNLSLCQTLVVMFVIHFMRSVTRVTQSISASPGIPADTLCKQSLPSHAPRLKPTDFILSADNASQPGLQLLHLLVVLLLHRLHLRERLGRVLRDRLLKLLRQVCDVVVGLLPLELHAHQLEVEHLRLLLELGDHGGTVGVDEARDFGLALSDLSYKLRLQHAPLLEKVLLLALQASDVVGREGLAGRALLEEGFAVADAGRVRSGPARADDFRAG